MIGQLKAVQQAVYTALQTDAALQSLVSGVHDIPPDDAAFPYLVIHETEAEPWRFTGGPGIRAELTLACYSRYFGKEECYDILARISAILDDAALTASGLTLVMVRAVDVSIELERDGRTHRGRVVIEVLCHD